MIFLCSSIPIEKAPSLFKHYMVESKFKYWNLRKRSREIFLQVVMMGQNLFTSNEWFTVEKNQFF